ncbi:MAG: MFS transporter [Desulforhopalus sp.]
MAWETKLEPKNGYQVLNKIRVSVPHRPPWILPIVILSQFAGGSLWFSGNAILDDLVREWNVSGQFVGYATSAVQLGFITGTLLFAWFTVSDRYSPRKVFFLSALLGATANSLIIILPKEMIILILLRYCTGVFLAGIYPVGMKIAAGWYKGGLGRALGYLVGALVFGTAFPHVLKAAGYQLDWQIVLLSTSVISLSGGVAMLAFVPDGPYIKKGSLLNGKALSMIFNKKDCKAAVLGYFGHCWEVYTLWAFLPLFLSTYVLRNLDSSIHIPLWAFLIIASGAAGCAIGGIVSKKLGSARVAFFLLAVSGCCCLLSPFFFSLPPVFFLAIMIVWGVSVAGDSPQYSTVIAQTVPGDLVGSALTLVNCIGFFITIVSLQLVDFLSTLIEVEILLLILLPGPLFGLYSMRQLVAKQI